MKRGYLSIGFFFILQPRSQVGPIGFINHGDFYVDFAFVVVTEQRIIGVLQLRWLCCFSFFLFLARGVFHSPDNVTD